VKTLLPVADRLKKRFSADLFCLVADRGMISAETLKNLDERDIPYILGSRMRKTREVREEVLARPGRYEEVHPQGMKGASPLKVKEVWVDDRRYIVCLNEKQARKDEQDRMMIIESLKEQLKKGPKSLVGNKGYRKYLKLDRDDIAIDEAKIQEESRYDGKWVLRTNTELPADMVALKYKELWQVDQVSSAASWLWFFGRNWTLALRKQGTPSNGPISSRTWKPSRKSRLKSRTKRWPFAPNVLDHAARSFSPSASPYLPQSGRYHDAYSIIKEQNVVPRLSSWYLSA
jgi:hypothetical protein